MITLPVRFLLVMSITGATTVHAQFRNARSTDYLFLTSADSRWDNGLFWQAVARPWVSISCPPTGST